MFVLVANIALFAMKSSKEESVIEQEAEEFVKNYKTSNCYYNEPINTGDYVLEFVGKNKSKNKKIEKKYKSECKIKTKIKITHQEKTKGNKEEFEIDTPKNSLSFVLASKKENSPYILVFTQKYKFKPQDEELSKEGLCEIMENPENILTIYNTKTGEPVKVLSDSFPELKNKKLSDIKFLENFDVVGIEHDKTYDIKADKIYSCKY